MYRIGVDVGGTFTDVVAVDGLGRVSVAKALSTPSDQSEGFIDGLKLLAGHLGLELRDLLRDTEVLVHGTTVATNALLEHKGARTGVMATDGHRDIIEMREGLKDDRYNLRMPPPVPLVPRSRVLGVRERIRADGSVATPLDRVSLEDAAEEFRKGGVESVAVTFLHSYRNPAHELAAGRFLSQRLPGVYLSLSSEVLPQIKEYERSWTTLVNAYVGPLLANYLSSLVSRLQGAGFHGDVLVMQSHGGVAPVSESARIAAGAVLSGPAGGVAAGKACAKATGTGDLITFDMGGTSTDICLLRDGEPQLTGEKRVGDARVALPSIDMHTLGAGGGSVAKVGADGILRVGPESAGASPGPACYGRGGADPTVTDANLVLGFLDSDSFLGGRMRLKQSAARTAVFRLAKALGVDETGAAAGVWQVVNANMADGIRIVSVRRGVDPRLSALVAFGGAAGLHVSAVARLLGIRRVIVPSLAPVLSAWGMLGTDLRYEMVRSHVTAAGLLTAPVLQHLFSQLEEEGRRRLGRFSGEIRVQRSLDMRYGEQIFEITVPLDGADIGPGARPARRGRRPDAAQAPTGRGTSRRARDAGRRTSAAGLIDEAVARFHRRHEEFYAYSSPGQEVVIVNVRVAVIGVLPDVESGSLTPRAASGRPRPAGSRRVFFSKWAEAPVYDLRKLRPGHRLSGPAIVESDMTTVLLLMGDSAAVMPNGWLDLTVTS